MTWTARALLKNLTNYFMLSESAKRQLLTWVIRPKFVPINHSLGYTVALDLRAGYPWYYQLYFCCLTGYFIWLYQTKVKIPHIGISTGSQIHSGNTGVDLTPPPSSCHWQPYEVNCTATALIIPFFQFLLSNNMKYSRFLSFTFSAAVALYCIVWDQQKKIIGWIFTSLPSFPQTRAQRTYQEVHFSLHPPSRLKVQRGMGVYSHNARHLALQECKFIYLLSLRVFPTKRHYFNSRLVYGCTQRDGEKNKLHF